MSCAFSLAPRESPAPALRIRLRESRDDEDIFQLVNEDAFQRLATHYERFRSIEVFRAWIAGLGDERFEIVVESNGAVAGFGGLYPLPDRQNHAGWLFLGVKAAFHGQGAGDRLVQTLVAAADIVFGLGRLQLTVYADNDIALRLYRKYGFLVEGRHRNFVRRGDGFIDAFSMARLRAEAGPPRSEQELRERLGRLALACGAGRNARP